MAFDLQQLARKRLETEAQNQSSAATAPPPPTPTQPAQTSRLSGLPAEQAVPFVDPVAPATPPATQPFQPGQQTMLQKVASDRLGAEQQAAAQGRLTSNPVAVRTLPPAEPQLDPAAERGIVGDIGSRLARGTTGLLESSAHMVDVLTPGGSQTAKDAAGYFKDLPKENQFLRPDVSEVEGKEGFVKRGIMGGVESTPMSAAILPPALIGAQIGSTLGPAGTVAGGMIGGAVGLGGLFFAGTYGKEKEATREKLTATRADLTLDQIEQLSHKNALTKSYAEVGGEAAGDLAAYLIFSRVPGGLALYKGGKTILKELISPNAAKSIATAVAKDMPFEVGSEVGTAYIQNEADRKIGLSDTSNNEAMVEAIIPAMFLSTGMGVAFKGYDAYKRKQAYDGLNTGEIPQRLETVNQVAGILAQETDKNVAMKWQALATSYVKTGQEIPLDMNLAELATTSDGNQQLEENAKLNQSVAALERQNLPTRDLIAIKNDPVQLAGAGLRPEDVDVILNRRYESLQSANQQLAQQTEQQPLGLVARVAKKSIGQEAAELTLEAERGRLRQQQTVDASMAQSAFDSYEPEVPTSAPGQAGFEAGVGRLSAERKDREVKAQTDFFGKVDAFGERQAEQQRQEAERQAEQQQSDAEWLDQAKKSEKYKNLTPEERTKLETTFSFFAKADRQHDAKEKERMAGVAEQNARERAEWEAYFNENQDEPEQTAEPAENFRTAAGSRLIPEQAPVSGNLREAAGSRMTPEKSPVSGNLRESAGSRLTPEQAPVTPDKLRSAAGTAGPESTAPVLPEMDEEGGSATQPPSSAALTVSEYTAKNGKQRIVITGDTVKHKARIQGIKDLRYNHENKGYSFPIEKRAEIMEKLGDLLGNGKTDTKTDTTAEVENDNTETVQSAGTGKSGMEQPAITQAAQAQGQDEGKANIDDADRATPALVTQGLPDGIIPQRNNGAGKDGGSNPVSVSPAVGQSGDTKGAGHTNPVDISLPDTREPWQIPKAEYVASYGADIDAVAIAKSAHANIVKKALAAGKDVPAEVLEPYKLNRWARVALDKINSRERENDKVRTDTSSKVDPGGTGGQDSSGLQDDLISQGLGQGVQGQDGENAGGESTDTARPGTSPGVDTATGVGVDEGASGGQPNAEPAEGGTGSQQLPQRETGEAKDDDSQAPSRGGSPQGKATPDPFAGNTVFTSDAVAAARARLKAKFATLNSGIDPELIQDMLIIGGGYFESGIRKFADWTKAVVADVGEKALPYLRGTYENLRYYPGIDTAGINSPEFVDEYLAGEKGKDVETRAASENQTSEDSTVETDKVDVEQEATQEGINENQGLSSPVEPVSNPDELVEHTTKKGKTLRGIIRTDLTKEEAQSIDPYTFKKDDGFFIREQYLQPPAVRTVEDDYGKSELEAARDGLGGNQAAPQTPASQIAAKVREALAANRQFNSRELFAWANEAYGGLQSQGAYTPKDAYDALELGINQYLADENGFKFKNANPVKQIGELEQLLSLVPTQTKRTQEQDDFQQYSTPPPLAFVAGWVANMQESDSVLEPSAGIGGLAVFAKMEGVKNIAVNELSERRRAILKEMGFDQVYGENAEQLNNVLPSAVKPTVVIMNPPFSATGGRLSRNKTKYGAAHIEQALKRLEPGGRLVAIVGEGMGADKSTFRQWWKDIAKEYTVRANVGMNGEGYRKYGTTFDNQLLVIDKTGPTQDNIIIGKVDSYTDLIPLLQGVRDARTTRTQQSTAQQAGQGETSGSEVGAKPEPAVQSTTLAVGAKQRIPADNPGSRGEDRPDAPVETENLDGRGNESQPGGRSADLDKGQGAISEGSGMDDAGSDREPAPVTDKLETSRTEKEQSTGDSIFEGYQPTISTKGAKSHPADLVESAAMAAVKLPSITYRPNIPFETVKSGKLSDVQLEAITAAGQAHQDTLPNGYQRGFFIGDGTGVGKGREIAGILWDNWNQGRKKSIWVSKDRTLAKDAKRDMKGIGWNDKHLMEQGSVKAGDAIPKRDGVLYTAYSTLASAAKTGQLSRLQAIIDWAGPDFDGVIAFDESHKMGNAISIKEGRYTKKPSQMALAALDLQKALPKAKVVYVSATGATEVSNLAYAERLGLWGEDTAFPNVTAFIGRVSMGGIAAMEVVARDMKAMGSYLARKLAYNGKNAAYQVKYRRLEHALSGQQREVYDELAGAWQTVLANIDEALAITEADSNGRSHALSAFWGSHQRFFNQVLTAMQMPSVISSIKQDVKDGKAVVLQITNTDEASTNRALANAESLEDVDITPRDQLMQMIENSFPVQQYEQYEDEDGNVRSRPVVDSNGNPVVNREAVAKREALLDKLGSIRVPDAPLDQILNVFGIENVAEVTGRSKRVVTSDDGTGPKKIRQGWSKMKGVADAAQFMADKKQILIFSEAGGTGASYHADLAAVNQRQRSHYILQAGWRADSAVQGLGRSHRSNQAVAPEYVLVTTDLKGHKRFISSIARKLSQLGALTEGERSASSQGLFSERDNLESEYAADAVEQLIHRVHRGQIPGIDMDTLVRELGLPKLVDEHGQLNATQVPTVPRFLNRILSMKIDMQNKVFDIFSALMDANVSKAEENGTLDTGLETLKAKKIKVVDTQAVYTDSRSGAVTEYVQLDVDYPVNKVPYDPRFKIVVNNQSGRPWQSAGNKTTTKEETGEIIEVVTLRNGRGNIRNVPKEDFAEKFTEIDGQPEARAAWDAALKDIPDTVTQREHLITGALLPIWDKLKGHPRIVRVQTGKETMLGRIIPGENISEVMALLDVEGKAVDMVPEDVQRAVLENGQTVTFDNGWKIKRKMVAGERRMEVEGMQYSDYNVLNGYGTFAERINYITRVFIPTGAAGNEVIEKITRSRKILTVTGNAVTSQNQNANLDPDSDEATKVQAGVEGKTVVDVAGFIAKNAPDKATRLIAEKVKQAIEAQAKSGMNFSFKVAHLGDMVPRSLVNARGASITSLDGSNNVEVWVNGADITGKVGVSYETVLHEIIHAATQGAIHLGNMTRFSGTDIANSVSDLYAVTNQIVRHFNNRVAQSKRGEATLTDFEKKIFDSSVNALGSPNEIISWAMTNKDMQDYLDTIKLGRTRTLWSKFVQAVRNMLGLDTSSDTALSEVLRIGEELLLSQPMELFAELQTGKQPTQVQTTAYQIASQQVSKATKPLTASFVKGTPHTGLYKNAPAMAQLSTGAILTLTREPGNVHDKNAVKIMLGTQAVGYVDKKINAKIAARMDAGENLQARVSKVTGRSVAPRFTVLIGTQADLAAKPATGTGTAPKGPGKPPTTPRPPSPRRHGQAAIDKLLLDVLGADKMSIMQDIRKNGLTPENEQAVLTKEITPVKETGAAKELWLAQFRAAPKAIARKSLSLLTLRQLRDIYRKVAPVEKFYQATRETAADTTKLMGEADKVYEKWSKLETKDADAMSMIMSEATVASVSPDIPFESRLDIKEAIEKMEKSADTLTGLQGSMEDVDDKVKWHEDRVIRLAGEIEAEKKRFSEHKRLAAKYDALPKEAKEVYQEVRKMYDANLGRVRDGLISRLERSTMSDASKKMAMDSIRLKFEQYLRNGPYFPLSRFGEYIVQITDDAGNREVHFFDFIGQRDRAVARWQAETTAAGAPRWTIKQKTSKDYSPEADGASSQFVSDMAKVIDNSTISSGEKSGLIDELNQLFIRSMPDMSHRKHFSHRKKVEGYSRDQIRAFASNMQHAAHHIARIRHADKMTSALSELNEIVRTSEGNADLTHVTDLFNELNKRHQILLNPKISPIAQALTSFGFIWNIGPSIASAMVNMSQTPLVAFPMMGARFNDGRGAFMALRRASAQYFGSPFVGSKGFDMSKNTKVGANARAMLAALEDDGTIDTSMALSLAQATSADLLNLAQTKNGGQMLKVMRVVSYPFHVTEVANRQITAVAAYELAVKHGATHEEAISQAREVVLDSHFDYSQANRARFMEGNVQRVLFLFKQYSQQMSYLLGRSFHQAVKGESQAVKNQARNQLMGIIGGHFLVSGAFGMPVIGGIAEVLEFFVNALGDDDEPWDWESALRNMLADTVGKTAGESIAHGPWRALPVLGDLDIASRVSLGDLWFRTPDRELEGKDAWNQYINMALGPLASNGASMAQGLSAMSEGEVARGVEMMLPKAIKDAMKTIRYAREGVTSWNDATLIDELNTVEMFGQVLGFSPARLNEMYEGKNAIKNLEAKLDDRKQQLVNGWIEATRAGDIDTANRYMKDMVQFTRKNPAFAITRQGLAQSVRMRAKVQAQTKNGVYMPAKREEMLKEGRFANI